MRQKYFALSLLLLLSLLVSGCSIRSHSSTGGAVVYVIQTAPPNMLEQLNSGEIDGFVAWEPYNARAVLEGTGKYLLMSSEIWEEHPCCVFATSTDLLDAYVEQAFLWAHIKATRFIQDPDNYEKVIQYTMEFTGSSYEVAVESLKNTEFEEYPDIEEFKDYYNKLKNSLLLKKNYKEIGYETEDEFFSDFFTRNSYDFVVAKLSSETGWVPEPVPVQTKVVIGYLNTIHQIQIHIAQAEGYYSAAGLVPGDNLQIKSYANGVAIMEAFRYKEIDAAYLGGAPATLKRLNDDVSIRIVGGANREGSAIVVSTVSGINTPQELAGKTIAVPALGTVQHFLLERVLISEGLKLQLK